MTEAKKDTIYIDVDDEITSIVEKVQGADHNIVALVLPKRAAVLQSIVNMKLLKRTADEHKKKVVLITSEAGLLPLAGAVGLFVAKNLQSKPGIPSGPEVSDKIETIAAEEAAPEGEEDPDLDRTKSIGALAGIGAVAAAADDDDVIEVDNEADDSADDKPAKKSKSKNKKLRVPNFNKFRTWLILGGVGAVLLIVLWIVGFIVLPKAHVTVKTDTTNINSSIAFTASPSATSLDTTKLIVPAKTEQVKKDNTQKVSATGQKDLGTPASGTVSLKNCSHSDGSVNVSSGTTVSTGGLTYITQSSVSLPASVFTGGGSCITTTKDVNVTAAGAGTQYNIASGQTFSVSGISTVNGTNAAAFSGGTSNIVKVVSQSDIDSAKQQIVNNGNNDASQQLQTALKNDGYYPITDSLTASDPQITSSSKVGDQANDVTVTATTTYSMVGVKQSDLKIIVDQNAQSQIDASKQTIQDEGLGSAGLQVASKNGNDTKVNLQTIAVAGPQLSVDQVRQLVAGKKKGDAIAGLVARPGVKSASVNYSPFWVSVTPKKASKITVVFEKSS